MGFLYQICIGIVIWFVISYIIIEGSNPFRPRWVNAIAETLGWIVKAIFVVLLFIGLTGERK